MDILFGIVLLVLCLISCFIECQKSLSNVTTNPTIPAITGTHQDYLEKVMTKYHGMPMGHQENQMEVETITILTVDDGEDDFST